LFEQQAAGNIADFDQLLIETTGVADPVPLLHTFKSSSLLSSNFELRRVVTTIDAALGEQTLTRFAEANKQVALADTILITKTDLLADEEVLVKLKNDIKRVNPWASIATGNLTEVAGLEESWIPSLLESVPESDGAIPEHGSLVHVSGDRPVASFSLSWSESLDWTAFGVWLTLLLHRHGQNVLRIKGLLNVKQAQGPVVFHCVQHIVHPPVHLDSWPTEDHTSRMTFILKGIDIAVIRRSLAAFNKLMNIRGSETLMHKGVGAGSTVRGRPVRRPSAPRWVK
jgi:G3E family GTPase